MVKKEYKKGFRHITESLYSYEVRAKLRLVLLAIFNIFFLTTHVVRNAIPKPTLDPIVGCCMAVNTEPCIINMVQNKTTGAKIIVLAVFRLPDTAITHRAEITKITQYITASQITEVPTVQPLFYPFVYASSIVTDVTQ
ncbi:hypothetical protein A7311_00655 [Paenibacillus polymyxa]|nr:hypothetical protein A7311_00655 [Paenibacillus polymyxa]